MSAVKLFFRHCGLNFIVLVALSVGFISQLVTKHYDHALVAGIGVAINFYFVWDIWRGYHGRRNIR